MKFFPNLEEKVTTDKAYYWVSTIAQCPPPPFKTDQEENKPMQTLAAIFLK